MFHHQLQRENNMQRDTQPPTASQERDSLVEGISMKGNPQRSERNGNRELAYYPAQPGRNEAPYITLSIDGQYTEKTSGMLLSSFSLRMTNLHFF